MVVISHRRFGTPYRSPSSGFKNPKGRDRQAVPKRRQEITTTRCVITQRGAVLNNQAYLPPTCRYSLLVYGLKFCTHFSFLKGVMHALPIFLYMMITIFQWRQQIMNLFFPSCSRVLRPKSRYSTQQSVLRLSQSTVSFLLGCDAASLRNIINKRCPIKSQQQFLVRCWQLPRHWIEGWVKYKFLASCKKCKQHYYYYY